MKPNQVKKLLLSEINSIVKNKNEYCESTDFIRNRKLPLDKVITTLLAMGGKSLTNELIELFNYSPDMATSSAFVQQRAKLNPELLKSLFYSFIEKIYLKNNEMRVLAVDGTDIQIATNPNDKLSYVENNNGSYNLLHINALYDLNRHTYLDYIIQKKRENDEHIALIEMVDNSNIPFALVIADRGYESYNNMAHIQEKGWKYLIRIKDVTGIKAGLDLPNGEVYDVDINLNLTRKQTNEIKKLAKEEKNHYRILPPTSPFDYLPIKNRKAEPTVFYELNFRIVRIHLNDGSYEPIVTNLDREKYPIEIIKELYESRWGIETSFRQLKHTMGLLHFHSKKVMSIYQEIAACFIMYNFTEMITSHVVIVKGKKEYTYKANFSSAACVCKAFFCGKTSSPNVEAIIARNVVPIRPGRHFDRSGQTKTFISFFYRVA